MEKIIKLNSIKSLAKMISIRTETSNCGSITAAEGTSSKITIKEVSIEITIKDY